MLTISKIAAKTPETKRENSVAKTQRTDFSQSINSPFDHILFLQRTIGNQAVQRLFKTGVIQAKLKIGQPNDIYEKEADRIAEEVVRMPEPIAGADVSKQTRGVNIQNKIGNPILQRMATPEGESPTGETEEAESTLTEEEAQQLSDALCIGITPGEGPTRCSFTDQQERRVRITKRWAWDLASRAALALSSGDQYIVRLTQRIFHISNPNIPSMVRTLDQIRDALWDTPVECGTCADDTCNRVTRTSPAYVPDDLSGIVICPFFFVISLSQMKRTFLHEVGHVVRIDDRPDYEHPPYCTESDAVECEDPCAGLSDLLHNVDAWARFIECAAYSY